MNKTIFIGVAFIAIGGLLWLTLSTRKTMETKPAYIVTDKAPKPIGPYSQAVAKGNALFVSGQIALDPVNGKLDTADIVSETKMVMENIKAILSAAGMSMNDVAKSTIYMTSLADFPKMNDVYGSYFQAGKYPARETVQVAALPKGVHMEISVVAVAQ
ncbi:MAG: TdcF protein [Bacteroidetes bacterium]|nr:MAG: TdcF protein [Bacteroidota bacterium]